VIASAFDMAKQGDVFAKQAAILGITAEQYQALAFAADRSGVSQDLLTTSMQKLSMGIGQAQAGTGALQSGLSALNPELLEQLKNADGNTEAFTIMMDAMAKTGSASERAALATAAFGKSGQKIANMSIEGANGLSGLIAEAERYGLMSDESAKASEGFVDAQTNLKQSFFGVRSEIAEKLIPALTVGMQKVADFVAGFEKMPVPIQSLIHFLPIATVALTTFLFAMNIGPIVTAAVANLTLLRTAFTLLGTAIAATPIGAAAVAIAALGTAVTLGVVNKMNDATDASNRWAASGTEDIKKIRDQMREYGEIQSKAWKSSEHRAQLKSLEKQIESTTGAVLRWNEETGKAELDNKHGWIRTADSMTKEINAFETRAARIAAAAKIEQDALAAKTAAAEKAANIASFPGLPKVAEQKKEKVAEDSEKIGTATELTALSDKFKLIESADAIHKQALLSQSQQFWTQESELSTLTTEAKIAKMQSDFELLKSTKILEAEEEVAMEKALQERIRAIKDEELNKDRDRKIASMQLIGNYASGVAQTFNNLATIAKNFGAQGRAMLVAAKIANVVQIGMSTRVAVMKAMADFELPFAVRLGNAITVGAMGATNALAVASTPIPSAETGIRDFTAPDSTRVDSTYLRVNKNEKVSVTPRGEDSSKMQSTTVMLDGRVLLKTIQEFFDNGELRVNDFNVAGAF
jgi:hypothetical protein